MKDPNNTITGQDVIVRMFSQHPVVNPLTQLSLQMILPRPIERVDWQNPPANAPQVDELAFSSDDSTLAGDTAEPPRSYPLIAAVEQKPVAGVANPRGNTRMLVAGDSIFLGNHYIEGGRRQPRFSRLRRQLAAGPHHVAQRHRPAARHGIPAVDDADPTREVRWLLLGALPGAVLLFGWLVWLARRK